MFWGKLRSKTEHNCRKKGGKEMKEEIQQKEAQGYVTPYEFKGKLPWRQAVPLGLQHVLDRKSVV